MPYVCELNAYDDMGHLLFHTNWKTKPYYSKIYEEVFFNIFYNNCANYLKTIKLPIYGIWAMSKNKEPDLFVKNLKGIFKKVVTMPIENENSVNPDLLNKIASRNNIASEVADNFKTALTKISSKEKKLIVCFGSLYNCGNILNQN